MQDQEKLCNRRRSYANCITQIYGEILVNLLHSRENYQAFAGYR